MNNAQHTPGPWTLYEQADFYCVAYEHKHIAHLPKTSLKPGEETENAANANLIVAAPDLLTALDSCVEIMVRAIGERLPVLRGTYCEEEDWETALRHARAAIAKAKGVQA